MKRIILIGLLSTIISAGTAFSQSSRFGPKAGVNYSTWYNTLLGNVDFRFGYQFGVAWDNDFGNKFHFAPEILFIQKGFTLRNAQTQRVDKARLNYIEVPLIGKFDLTDKKGNRPFFSLGMTLSYYLGGDFEQTQDGQDVSNGSFTDGPDKKFDIGALAGAGMDLGRFIFEIRGQLGFVAPYYFDTGSSATISFNFSYLFGGSNDEEDELEEYEEEY